MKDGSAIRQRLQQGEQFSTQGQASLHQSNSALMFLKMSFFNVRSSQRRAFLVFVLLVFVLLGFVLLVFVRCGRSFARSSI